MSTLRAWLSIAVLILGTYVYLSIGLLFISGRDVRTDWPVRALESKSIYVEAGDAS